MKQFMGYFLSAIAGFVFVSCVDLGLDSGSDSSDAQRRAPSSPVDPAVDDDPRDTSEPGGGDYVFGGKYAGDCLVRVLGARSKSCKSNMNIYHEKDGGTIGFIGLINVDMGFSKASYPITSEPLNIIDGRLVEPASGSDLGEIDHNGFALNQLNGDYMRFDSTSSGGLDFVGQYQDPSYGTVMLEGSLEKVAD